LFSCTEGGWGGGGRSALQLVCSKLVYPDTRSTILALFLLYFFRVFERRSGSRRFSAQLAAR